jgi:hypothetical protein
MENWARFVEVFSVYLFSSDVHGVQLLSDVAKKAWGHLRRFILYHMRPAEEYSERARKAARRELLEFAKILDTVSNGIPGSKMKLVSCNKHAYGLGWMNMLKT